MPFFLETYPLKSILRIYFQNSCCQPVLSPIKPWFIIN